MSVPSVASRRDAAFLQSVGELSSSEDEVPVRVAAVDAGSAAVGPLPVQPGESITNAFSSLQAV